MGNKLALSLSGGGVRATTFHLGVLLWLAHSDQLENVAALSTVSGGSLAAALIFSLNGLKWPSSAEYLTGILPRARHLLTQRSLQARAARGLLTRPWKILSSRGDLFAAALEAEWQILGTLKQLPAMPFWIINATTYETGRNWRFSREQIGDWQAGHNFSQDVKIATAVAASAAIPYMAGFVKLSLAADGWFSIDPATDVPVSPRARLRHSVRLWDGGVYENLGLEALWKPQRAFTRPDTSFLLVSDASAHLGTSLGYATGVFTGRSPFIRPPRLFDIATEQTRALRSRMIIDAVVSGRMQGSILRLGRSVQCIDRAAKTLRAEGYDSFLTESAVQRAGAYPTNAAAMSAPDFENLLRHGFETADATLTGYCGDIFPKSSRWADALAVPRA